MSNAAKSFDLQQPIRASYITILIIQIKLFSDLYLAKLLNILAKQFLICIIFWTVIISMISSNLFGCFGFVHGLLH